MLQLKVFVININGVVKQQRKKKTKYFKSTKLFLNYVCTAGGYNMLL